jgi:hypothetical protein
MLCDVLLHAGCVVFGGEGVCELAWFEEHRMSSNKELLQRRMRTIFCDRSMNVTKTSDILTMDDVSEICGLPTSLSLATVCNYSLNGRCRVFDVGWHRTGKLGLNALSVLVARIAVSISVDESISIVALEGTEHYQ